MKTTLTCSAFKALHRGTLKGFADIEIRELHMTVFGCAVHEKGDKRWCQLPSKPMLKDGSAVTDDSGKVKYFPSMAFSSREVADAFSSATIAAVVAAFPDAFDAERRPAMARDPMDDAIPF